MNLRDLEYVVAVADHGHFGRAAAACNVSQPTLSGQILKLEAELGLRLFDREGRGARVSDRAATVVAQARATLAAVAGVTAAAQAARDPFAGELGLGVITTVAPYLLPIALPELAQALPRTPLYLVEDLTDRLLARLRDGALDAAVTRETPNWPRSRSTTNPSSSSPPVIPESAVAPRSASKRSIRAPFSCWRRAIVCATRRSRSAMRPKGPRSARTCAGRASKRCVTLPRPDRGRRSRPSSLTPNGGARARGSRGDGASRLIRIVFKRGSPREAALEALAARLRSTAGAALAKSLREADEGVKRA